MAFEFADSQPTMPRQRHGRLTTVEILSYVCSVAIVFTFAQGWAAPLTGWVTDPSELSLLKLGFLPGYALTLLLAAASPARTISAVVRTPLIYVLVSLALASSIWSFDGAATIRRVIALFFTTFAGTVLASRWSLRQLNEIIAAQFAILMVLSFIFALLPPHHGIMTELFPGAWRGVWTEKNGLGALMALGTLSCLASAVLSPPRRMFWVAATVGCLALVLLSTSKTSLLALLLGIAAMVGVGLFQRGPILAVISTWLTVSATIIVGGLLALAPDVLFGALNKDATLTGRTEIWTAAIRQGLAHDPVNGFGYGVLWDHRKPFEPASWIAHDAGFAAGHAHNGWLQVWLGLGFVGLAIWTAAYFGNFFRIGVAAYTTSKAYAIVPFFLVFSVSSLTEVSILDYQDIEWMIYVAFAASLALTPRQDAEAVTPP